MRSPSSASRMVLESVVKALRDIPSLRWHPFHTRVSSCAALDTRSLRRLCLKILIGSKRSRITYLSIRLTTIFYVPHVAIDSLVTHGHGRSNELFHACLRCGRTSETARLNARNRPFSARCLSEKQEDSPQLVRGNSIRKILCDRSWTFVARDCFSAASVSRSLRSLRLELLRSLGRLRDVTVATDSRLG